MIYGTSFAKFKSGSTVKDLDYCTIKPQWKIAQLIEHKSILTANTTYIRIGLDKAIFEVTCNIWKNPDPQGVLLGLLAYEHSTVKFWPHEDSGSYIMDGAGNEADFFISEMKPMYLDDSKLNLNDKLFIRFESLSGIVMPGAIGRYLVDSSGDFLVDGSGNKLLFP